MAHENGRTTTADWTITDRVFDHDAFLAEEFPQPIPLIEGILGSGTANNWSGAPGVGKTWAALSAARAIAGGTPWLGQFPTTRGRVLIVDQESIESGLQSRLRMLNRTAPLPPGSPLFLKVTTGLYVDDDPDDPTSGYSRLSAMLGMYRPDLLILDSFTRFHRANENDAGAVADVNQRFRNLIDSHGCALILIDHTRKPSPLATNDDPGARLRGSGEKLAFVDTALAFEKAKAEPGTLIVTPTKGRWFKMPEPFSVRLEVDEDGETARLVHAGDVSRDENAIPGAIMGAIHDLKAQAGADAATVATISAYLDQSESTTRKHLKKLEDAKLVYRRKRPKQPGENWRPSDCYDVGNPA